MPVNNYFSVIGVALTNYVDVGNAKFKSYYLRIEVEKMGSKAGNVFEIDVQCYGNNKALDFNIEPKGEQVVVVGYIDDYKSNNGNIIPKLVAQNIYVLGKQETKNLVVNDVEAAEELPPNFDPVSDSGDDDLPF